MLIVTVGHDFRYEMEKLCRLFFPFEKITFSNTDNGEGFRAVTAVLRQNDSVTLLSELYIGDKSFKKSEDAPSQFEADLDYHERRLAVMLFNELCEATKNRPEWGILTGVRPAKLFRRLELDGGIHYAERYFADELLVSAEKLSLCGQTAVSEEEIISLSSPESFSFYAAIPFCPTRCSYCSFVSHSVDKAGKLIPEYFNLLLKEIELTAKCAKDLNLKMETAYIGGGTPTTLDAEQLKRLTFCLGENLDFSSCREFTVEAGRPDTITREKLVALKDGGVTRISINPQTMNDSVLREIGRCHTTEQTEQSFLLARDIGFSNINMDLIAGLPTDTAESFADSLEKVIDLDPESVTVHSLAMKRAAGLSTNNDLPKEHMASAASTMVQNARRRLTECGILPYYMYRQSKTVGNLENVGYAKVGHEGLYNVYIMDETHTILACGASAVTKLKQPDVNNIERIYNFKYPYEYISRFSEIVERKKGIGEFYAKYCSGNK